MARWLEYPELTVLLATNERDLSMEDMVQLDNILAVSIKGRELAWRQYNAGVLDEASWLAELEVISLLVGSQLSRDWWQRAGKVQFVPEFAQIVSQRADSESYHPYWEEVLAW